MGAPGENLWSGASGLAGALTNMTELARSKGGIVNSYPVRVGTTTYPDAEAAYQALKFPGDEAYNDGLMIDLIALKFQQHPRLLQHTTRRGGLHWLGRCSHLTGAKSSRGQSWEGVGPDSRFIHNLMHGYQKALSGKGPLTRVVHLKKSPYDVYIGRAMPGEGLAASPWANPFVIGKDGTRDEVIAQYHQKLMETPKLLDALRSLEGKTLGCWCKETPTTSCHGDVLVALVHHGWWRAPQPQQGLLF